MARVTQQTIEQGYHTGTCQACNGASAAAWSGGIELCKSCICTVMPKLLADALEDVDRETVYQFRETLQVSFWQAVFHRLDRETKQGGR